MMFDKFQMKPAVGSTHRDMRLGRIVEGRD